MNFGEKFPYALLTFSQKFVEADCGPHLLPKVVEAGYWYTSSKKLIVKHTHHPTPSPKSLSNLVIGYTTPPIVTRTPSSKTHTNTPTHPYTNYTPTMHKLYTTPDPSSCELTATKCGKNRQVFGS